MSKQLNIFLQIFLLASILFFVEKSFSCSANSVGTVKCSKLQGGGAAVNSVGTVKCSGGCETGSSSYCETGSTSYCN